MAELRIAFRLPTPGFPRALFVSDYGLRGGRLLVDGAPLLEVATREALARGLTVDLPPHRLTLACDGYDVRLLVDGAEAPREEDLRARPSRSAWAHALLALAGSAFGFVASWLYVERARASGDPWAMKMALHMAAWHLLLTVTLFPASVWGQRAGIRAVQGVSLLFFLIHLGIALANVEGAAVTDGIALLNGASGLAFLAAALYGQRAHADMDPLRAGHMASDLPDRGPPGDGEPPGASSTGAAATTSSRDTGRLLGPVSGAARCRDRRGRLRVTSRSPRACRLPMRR